MENKYIVVMIGKRYYVIDTVHCVSLRSYSKIELARDFVKRFDGFFSSK